MKTLLVTQNSEIERFIDEHKTQENGYVIWADSGKRIQYPISIEDSNKRGTIWIHGKVAWTKTFDEICEMFPNLVRELPVNSKAGWGTGIYVKCVNGFPMLMDSNWDSSD